MTTSHHSHRPAFTPIGLCMLLCMTTACADPAPPPSIPVWRPAVDVDGGVASPADAGVVVDAGASGDPNVIAEGQICGLQRDRVVLDLDVGRLHHLTLATTGDDDPDLLLYRQDAPHHALLIGRAYGADDVWLTPTAGETWVAEITSPFGDCESFVLSAVVVDDKTVNVLHGSVLYDDKVYGDTGFTGEVVERPARGITVELVADGQGVLAATTTGPDGRFTLAHPLPTDVDLRLRAVAMLEAHGQWARTRDRGNSPATYAIHSDLFTAATVDDVMPFEAIADVDTTGGAFNILDVTYDANAVIVDHTEQKSPLLTYSWQRGQAFGCGSCFSGTRISLGGQFEDPDEYDDDIVLHEFGHYFAAYYAPDDSPGGSHRDMRVEPRLAWGEGLAYFVSSMIRRSPSIVDNYIDDIRFTDLERVELNGESLGDFKGSSTGGLDGRLREETVGALLWDAYDDDTAPNDVEPHDQLHMSEAGIFDVLLTHMNSDADDVGPSGVDLADWLWAQECMLNADDSDAAMSLVDERELPWPNTAGAACAQKTLRTEPDLTVDVVDGVAVLALDHEATVDVGVLMPSGERRPGRRLRCARRCEVDVPRKSALWVHAVIDDDVKHRSVWRTVVPAEVADAFSGEGHLGVPHKHGPVREFSR